MSNAEKNLIDLKYEVSWNLRWLRPTRVGYRTEPVGHRYVNRNKLAEKLRELMDNEDVTNISVVEHRVLGLDELEALLKEEV